MKHKKWYIVIKEPGRKNKVFSPRQSQEAKHEEMNKGSTIKEKHKLGKQFVKKAELNKKVKFVLNMLSHYSFRQHLHHKCLEYGCEMKIVTEEYTSKTCM